MSEVDARVQIWSFGLDWTNGEVVIHTNDSDGTRIQLRATAKDIQHMKDMIHVYEATKCGEKINRRSCNE